MSSSTHQIELDDVTVIVAARNEERNIEKCVSSILENTKGMADIIVVNDGSTDQTAKILESFGAKIRVLTTKGEGASIARNTALQHTQKTYVAFADGDCSVDGQWLESLIHGLQGRDKKFVNIGGSQKMRVDATEWEKFHAEFLESVGFVSDYIHKKDEVTEVKHNPTCNVLYHRDEIMKLNGFDEKLWPCEDLDLDIRLKKLGYKFLYTPNAKIYHQRPETMGQFAKMMMRYGFGQAQIFKKHGPCQKIHAIPMILVLLVGALIYVASYLPIILYLLVMMIPGLFVMLVMFWLLFVVSDFSGFLRKKTMVGLYLFPTIFFWNIGFFKGLFQSKKITHK